MNINIRIKCPFAWKQDYLSDSLKRYEIPYVNYVKDFLDSDVKILVTNILTIDEISNLPNLKFLIVPTSSLEGISISYLRRRGIKVFQNKNLITKGVINYTLDKIRKFSNGSLEDYLRGKTIGLLGFGSIGRGIYSCLKDYDCSFRIIRKKRMNLTKNKIIFTGSLQDVHEVISKSDILINSLPFNDKTKGVLLNKTSSIKNDSIVINLSRKGILNEAEILSEVIGGRLGGAIFDVYPEQIIPLKYKSNKIILTPHIAGIYGSSLDRIVDYVVETIKYLSVL